MHQYQKPLDAYSLAVVFFYYAAFVEVFMVRKIIKIDREKCNGNGLYKLSWFRFQCPTLKVRTCWLPRIAPLMHMEISIPDL